MNEGRPILAPRGDGFEAAGVFNPAVVKAGDRFVMLYRAQDARGISRLGYATSEDGVRFTREAEPVLSPEAEYQRGGGVEDPRLVRIADLYSSPTPPTTAGTPSWRWRLHAICVDGIARA